MNRVKTVLIPAILLALLICCCGANAMTLACHPGTTDLYDEPGGTVIAGLFYNTPVTIQSGEEREGWSRVTVGDDGAALTGWVADADLDDTDPGSAASLRIGNDAIPCGGVRSVPILAEPKEDAEVRETWKTDGDRELTVTGITSDSRWLLAVLQEESQPVLWGFVSSDNLCSYSTGNVLAKKASATVNLRETPSSKGKVIGAYYSGALADLLYSYEDTYGWSRVNIGGVAGYMMNQFLELDSADGIPYRCPMLPLKGDSAPLYAAASGTEAVEELPALTKAEVFCILGKAGDRWHVKVYTDEVGVWIFGFVDTEALKGSRPTCPSIDATISKATPLYGTGEGEDPKIKKGKKVRISAFYTARPDLEDAMPLDYDRDGVAWVGVTAFIKGDYGFDEPYYGYVPVDALKYDKKLKLPANMGVE